MEDEILKRPSSEALDEMLGVAIPVLDHGFIRVIDYMGDDNAIVQAARTSYSGGTRAVNEDRGLIRYLMRHRHTTPFEMCDLKLHVKMPIFVARQWVRHRTASVNEESARYSILANEFYVPNEGDLAVQSKTNKQGRGETVDAAQAAQILSFIRAEALDAYAGYEALLNDRGDGVPIKDSEPMVARELARMNLTLNFYTQWYWKTNLHNLLHFLGLRADPHAQLEIRRYADEICGIVRKWVPHAWEAFEDYRFRSVTFSRQEMDILRDVIQGAVDHLPSTQLRPFFRTLFDKYGIESARERGDFLARFGITLPPQKESSPIIALDGGKPNS